VRAVVCNNFGPVESLVIEERPRPAIGPGQVLVEVHAAGVNFTDVLVAEGRSQLKRELPLTPGTEAAGRVLAVGAGVTRVRAGDRVFGTKTHGTYAEEVVFAADEVDVIPDAMDIRDAATFYIASMNARYGLELRAKLRAGENLLVLGAGGGVGLAAIQTGKALGAYVVAAASSDEKLSLAKAAGADGLVRYDRGPLDLAAQKAFAAELIAHARSFESGGQSIGKISSVQEGAGYHVILDGVGGTYSEPALRTLAWQGRFLSIGFAAGMAKIPLGPLLFKNADIMGLQPSSDEHRLPGRNPEGMKVLYRWYLEGKVRPHISNEFPLERAAAALRMVQDRKATGRIVLTTSRAQT
jgi:NADPH2:quinone reductase